MDQTKLRNVAIIAHVDHGKTTLVDELFRQSGMFRENQSVDERLMDSMDLERERGITISSKNGSFQYGEYRVNIIDTPGHADFGGQVERVLKMAEGAVLLVDAQEGPMPQTYFVLKKALALHLAIVVVINKIDKPAARPEWAVNEVFDLFVKLNAPDDILDFPVIYASSREGYSMNEIDGERQGMEPICEQIVRHIPPPGGNSEAPLQMLVSSVDYSPYLGRLSIGKISNGTLNINKEVVVVLRDGEVVPARITKIFRFDGNERVPTDGAGTGELVAVAGMDEVTVGVTFTDPDHPTPLPPMEIDPPTISMSFIANDSPFAGRDGTFVTSRHLADRLGREVLADVALHVEQLPEGNGFNVSGRGELHLSILIERMRREGYEFQVTRPQVILLERDGKKLEPYEQLTVDVDEVCMGTVIDKLGQRKGQLLSMETENGMARLLYRIPTRGLLGFRSEFLTDTKGMGVMNYVFGEYDTFAGEIRQRQRGVLISMNTCSTVAYAIFNLQSRGRMFFGPGVPVYQGQIVGEHCRENDLAVNIGKGKKLSNMRASGTDESVTLVTPVDLSLEECINFINDDELVEITPKEIRLRKRSMKKRV
ncbi:MAG: translational GTPase TypA [Lentisphaeria bacterium]|nr:translational GTPase TypA [Lentisphaeria bacterium]